VSENTPAVVMVTGAYFPEASGAGLQCRALIRAFAGRVKAEVLTTAVDESVAIEDVVDGTPVHRVRVSGTRRWARALAAPRLIIAALRAFRRADIVHLHGFSSKTLLLMAIARLLRRPVIIKLTSVGHDDAISMKRNGGRWFRSFSSADRFVAVSPRFAALHAEAGLAPERLTLIPNGVDLDRFRPPAAGERDAIRREVGLPIDAAVVLFVGFFSHEKHPDVAFGAWTDTFAEAPGSVLVLLGRTRSPYHEIDPAIADEIRRGADRLRCRDRLMMVEYTDAIERFYRAADVLILPSSREGLPNVVLEAMATGLPCVVSRLPDVTDAFITDGRNGLLVEPGDRAGFARALSGLLNDPARRAALGAEARRSMESRFSLAQTASAYIGLYRELLSGTSR
jgi:glycosyltransferase involved in cell wall biosynthesis